jgi:GMP synthase-like glutamine amidotransferase
MRAHCLQHVAAEGPAYIAEWLAEAGHTFSITHLYNAEPLPDVSDVDLLVVMGGPMGANEDATIPWLAAEVAFIRAAIDAGVRVLGVCLGAQLVARALGAAVHPNPEPEIGWYPVRAVPNASGDAFTFPSEITVFHWHGDTFELPEGATRLASSEACANQACQYGDRVMALQCHLEATPVAVTGMVSVFGEHLTPAAYVQSADEILDAPCAGYVIGNAVMAEVLAYLTRDLG